MQNKKILHKLACFFLNIGKNNPSQFVAFDGFSLYFLPVFVDSAWFS